MIALSVPIWNLDFPIQLKVLPLYRQHEILQVQSSAVSQSYSLSYMKHYIPTLTTQALYQIIHKGTQHAKRTGHWQRQDPNCFLDTVMAVLVLYCS